MSIVINSPWVISTTLFLIYISWRVWRLVLNPILDKDQPKQLPYWIPFVGHTIAFFKDQNQVLETARKYFNDSKEPYSITIAGQSIYILTSPRDIAAAYKDSSAISWDPMVIDLHRLVGISKHGMDILFTPSLQEKWSSDRKTRPTFLDVTMKTQHHQLLDAEKVNDLLGGSILPFVDNGLKFHSKKSSFTPMTTTLAKDDNDLTVSLMALCTEMILEAQIQAYFGESLWKVYPEVISDYLEWEKQNWKILFQLPAFMIRDAITTKDNFISGLEKYFQLPAEEKEDWSYYIKTIEAMALETGMNSRDLAAVIMLQLWAILANVSKVSFWLMAHLTFDDTLRQRVQAEIEPAWKGSADATINYDFLNDQCPLLGSMFHETLRQVVSAAMARDVLKTTLVGGKVLQKGHKLLLPLMSLHRDHSTWGPDPYEFRATRFQENPKLLKSPSLRPFGGGIQLCPGRFFAKKLVVAFVGSLLLRYEIRLNNREATFPRIDNSRPSPGAVNVMEGDDVILNLKRRQIVAEPR